MTIKHHCIVLEFSTEKDVQDLLDLIAGRVYTLEGVSKGEMTVSTMETWKTQQPKAKDEQ